MINSVYGKTMEKFTKKNLTFTNVRLANNAKDFLKYTNKPTYITHKIFGKDYADIHEVKPVLTLNKPIYAEFTILDLSKWKMYVFHYSFIIKNFYAELLFTDTDSLKADFLSEKICLTIVIIQKIQRFLMKLIKKLLEKWKMNLVELLQMNLLD